MNCRHREQNHHLMNCRHRGQNHHLMNCRHRGQNHLLINCRHKQKTVITASNPQAHWEKKVIIYWTAVRNRKWSSRRQTHRNAHRKKKRHPDVVSNCRHGVSPVYKQKTDVITLRAIADTTPNLLDTNTKQNWTDHWFSKGMQSLDRDTQQTLLRSWLWRLMSGDTLTQKTHYEVRNEAELHEEAKRTP